MGVAKPTIMTAVPRFIKTTTKKNTILEKQTGFKSTYKSNFDFRKKY